MMKFPNDKFTGSLVKKRNQVHNECRSVENEDEIKCVRIALLDPALLSALLSNYVPYFVNVDHAERRGPRLAWGLADGFKELGMLTLEKRRWRAIFMSWNIWFSLVGQK